MAARGADNDAISGGRSPPGTQTNVNPGANTATSHQTISTQNCRKIFIQRDYSEGTNVKFQTRFPAELQDKIEREQFEYTVKMMNTMYQEAGKANCATFCEGAMACMTAYLIHFCSETHYEKCLKKVARFVVEQNELVVKSNENGNELNEDERENEELVHGKSDEMELINEIKLEEDETISLEQQENDSLVDAGSVEEDDLGSLLHDVCDDDEVSQLGGLLALADDCGQVTSNPTEVRDDNERKDKCSKN